MSDEVTELTSEECWQFLADEELGRLAFRLVDEVHLVPVNYVVDDGDLLIRTAPGNKLLAAAMGSQTAFEIDRNDDRAACSVVVRGRLRQLGEDEEHRLDVHPMRPWVTSPKYAVVALEPSEVTGRKFRLRQPVTDAGDR